VWPETKPRTAQRERAVFKVSMAKAEADLHRELDLWFIKRYVISMAPRHLRAQVDPAVALWFYVRTRKPAPTPEDLRVITADRFDTVKDNMRAVGLTLKSLRAIERYGTYSLEQAAEGMRALPPPGSSAAPNGPPWWDVLEVDRDWPIAAIERVAKQALGRAHPDVGGDRETFDRLNEALKAARGEKR